jgi:hypothetical protein
VTFRLITADERIASLNKVSMAIFGRSKVGKTTLCSTLDPETTLFVNLEAGMLSLQGWRGQSIEIRSWEDAVDIACLIGGVNPGAYEGKRNPKNNGWDIPPDSFCPQHFHAVSQMYPWFDRQKIKRIFFDSISDLTRLGMAWARTQPQAYSERTGKPDIRGAYGLLGQEAVKLLKHLQHTPGMDIIFVGGLDVQTDDYGGTNFKPQSEGAKVSSELPYIVDQIVTLSDFDVKDGVANHNLGKGDSRFLVCKSPNPWGLPAGDRSGKLDLLELPHLGNVLDKIRNGLSR